MLHHSERRAATVKSVELLLIEVKEWQLALLIFFLADRATLHLNRVWVEDFLQVGIAAAVVAADAAICGSSRKAPAQQLFASSTLL